MEDSAKTKIPRLVAGVQITALPIGPMEGFVLSRIDGTSTVSDIAEMTALDVSQAAEIVGRLVELGAAEWVAPKTSEPRRTATPSGGTAKAAGRATIPTPGRGIVRTKPPPPGTSRVLYDPAELEEDVELDVERRRKVLDTFYRLDELDHYELLGVPYEADRKDIRNAYFDLSKVFHPDTLFRKRLGSYKSKMETIFKRLTDAYEVLGKKKSREDYDGYLKVKKRMQGVQALLERGAREAEQLEREASAVADRAIVEPPAPAPPAADDAATVSSAPSAQTEAGRQRTRELTARRLAAATGRPLPSARPAAPPSAPPPTASTAPQAPVTAKAERASDRHRDVLLRGLATSLRQAAAFTGGVDRLGRYVQEAKAAEADGDLVSATNALRLALAMAPDRADIKQDHDRLRRALAISLADSYAKQAEYEEKAGRWDSAAISWGKVAEGRPTDPEPARRAALALIEAGGDLHRARRLAQTAVELAPRDVQSRIALGRVYLAANLKLNALRELEAALELDPADEMVKNLLRQAKG